MSLNASIYVISALAGNAFRESHINPCLQQKSGTAFGLFQWDGSRKVALKTWLLANGYSLNDPNGQMQYLIIEGDWVNKGYGYRTLDEFLHSTSTDITSLVQAFCYCWERPGKPELAERVSFATKVYDYILAHYQDTNITAWETEPQYYLTEAQALNNAVLMFRFYSDGTVTGTGTSNIDMSARAAKLVSSDNYQFLTQENDEENSQSQNKILAQKVKDSLTKLRSNSNEASEEILRDENTIDTNDSSQKLILTEVQNKVQSEFSIASNLVEAPFIEIQFKDIKIGSYHGDLDNYPNYVKSLKVTKSNGVINQYSIQLVHQIRYGDDPNLLDELLSYNNYNKITIRYGDSNSKVWFQDTNVLITNVSMNRSYSGYCITYTISATSECTLANSYITNYKAITAKPSTVINTLLYNSNTTSDILLEAFPAMKDKTWVASSGLIPSNDSVLDIDSKENISPIEYLTYLVACMSNQNSSNNVIRNSTYYITFNDDSTNGSYFKISEIAADSDPYKLTTYVYDLTINYPEDIVYEFSVNQTDSWELLYKNSKVSSEYAYSIDDNGNTLKMYSPSINNSSKILSEVEKNWWTQVVKFPINASVTMRGLLKPVMLMNYININVMFYGQKHITSGMYAITSQEDNLSASGYRTTLGLVRVGDN